MQSHEEGTPIILDLDGLEEFLREILKAQLQNPKPDSCTIYTITPKTES